MKRKIKELEEEWQAARDQEKPIVTAEDIAEVVSMWTGIPVVQLASDETSPSAQDGRGITQAYYRSG